MILENGTNFPLAPQAFAETAPQFWPSYFVPRLGMTLETAFASYGQLYRTQPWVYTAVQKVASSIARLGVNVWDQSAPSGQVLDSEGPFASLMANPCATMDPYSFWAWTASVIEIYGEAFWFKDRSGRGNRISSFIPVHPSMVQIFRDVGGDEAYRFMGRPSEVFARDDVVVFKSYNPDNTMRGMSRLEPLRLTLQNEDSSRRAMAAWWRNGARPSMVLSSERELGTEGRERLKMAFQSEHQGSGNRGRVVVLEDGVTAQPMQFNADEMAYIEGRKLSREEVAAVMDLPPASIQIHDHATYSNVTENMRSLYRDSMAPRIGFIESCVNWQVGREFYGPKVMQFAVAEQLRGAFEQRAEAVARLIAAGVYKPAEGRQLFDLNDAGPDADKLYIQGAMVPLGGYQGGVSGDGGAPNGSTHVPALDVGGPGIDVPSAAAQKFIRDIGGKVGRGVSLQQTVKALLDKHPGDEEVIKEACAHIIERRL